MFINSMAFVILFFNGFMHATSSQLWLADRACQSGNLDQAAIILDAYLEEQPDEPVALYNRAKIAAEQKNYAQARDLFAMVTQLPDIESSQKLQAYFNAGDACMYMQQFNEAIDAYNEVLKIESHHQKARERIELAKKLLNEQKQKQQQDKNNKDQSSKDQKNERQDAENKDGNSQEKNQQPQKSDKQKGSPDQQKDSQSGQPNDQNEQSDSSKQKSEQHKDADKDDRKLKKQSNQKPDKQDDQSGLQDKSEQPQDHAGSDEGKKSKHKEGGQKQQSDSSKKGGKADKQKNEEAAQDDAKESGKEGQSAKKEHNKPHIKKDAPKDVFPKDVLQERQKAQELLNQYIKEAQEEKRLRQSELDQLLTEQEKQLFKVIDEQDKENMQRMIRVQAAHEYCPTSTNKPLW